MNPSDTNMPIAGLLDRLGDTINPIVVKELRQAVQSRFVVAVLLVFLLVQLLFMGIYLMVQSLNGSLYAADFQAGRRVFAVLQGILLGTCMLCIPAYSGFRLAAERSDFHVDLFYVSALRPRAIVAGKLVAALVLTILIFSACTPFMAFTYFLRGLDLTSIFFIIAVDFLAVAVTATAALFIAVVPAGRVFKVLLGVVAVVLGATAFGYALVGTILLLDGRLPALMAGPDFWAMCLAAGLVALGIGLLLYTATVGLLSPPSGNRTLPIRVAVTVFCLASGPLLVWCAASIDATWPLGVWLNSVDGVIAVCLIIAISEREQWGPRIARAIPRRWWQRPLAFLFFSGAAGGLAWACLLYGVCWLAGYLAATWLEATLSLGSEMSQTAMAASAGQFGYDYCYSLTALFLRRTLIRVPIAYTWVLALALALLGGGLPYLLTFLVFYRDWDFWTVYPWLLTDQVAGAYLIEEDRFGAGTVVLLTVAGWAAVVTILNASWFIGQVRRFRPYAGPSLTGEVVRPILSATPMDATQTAP
jgi:hypothetical protein